MTRLPTTFACRGTTLAGTLDVASGSSGLLIVSGGNEVRSGAFSGQAQLAARIAAAGHPVFRFDRRGVGDSDGENEGFRGAGPDIAAAIDAFHALAPQVNRIVAFGNCDGASALMLSRGAGCSALVLSNPWTIEDADKGDSSAQPPAALRARYLAKLRNPREVWRLLTGGVDLGKLVRGLGQAAKGSQPPSSLAQEIAEGLAHFAGPVRILLAGADRTAQLFAESWDKQDPRLYRCDGAGHAYVEPHAREWLANQLLEVLRG